MVHDDEHQQTNNVIDANEFVVRREMEGLGISSDLLNSHIERGARSAIIGTYRLLLHRYRVK